MPPGTVFVEGKREHGEQEFWLSVGDQGRFIHAIDDQLEFSEQADSNGPIQDLRHRDSGRPAAIAGPNA